MARQVGTAVGVAVFGAVFLGHIDTAMPEVVAGLPAEQQAEVTVAASHFVAAGPGDVRAESEAVIVDGFVVISVAGLAMCVAATACAFFIRHSPNRAPVAAPVPERAQEPGGGRLSAPGAR
jgi:hypothetical protein